MSETYSLRLITDFLQKYNIPFTYHNANVGYMFVNHGCRITLHDKYRLSIQTHPLVTKAAFAETALQGLETDMIVDDGTYGYDDVIRWKTPEELFEHIQTIIGDEQ